MDHKNNKVILKNKKRKNHFKRSLEYEMMASLTLQTFVHESEIDFEHLLSIDQKNRIPGLIIEY